MSNKTSANLWKPGQSGNPAGRPPGQSSITRLRGQLEADVPGILQALITAAKGGNVQAARLILERVLPPVKSVEPCIELALVEKTLTGKGMAVLEAVSTGELAPSQGSQLITSIGSLARVSEIDDLERRIVALEMRHIE